MTSTTSTTDAEAPAATTTKLSTVLTYLGAGPAAIADMQRRIATLADLDPRINVAQIMSNEDGIPTCTVSFECGGYNPPVDGTPDRQAIRDLQVLLGDVNLDGCLLWSTIEFLVDDQVSWRS